MTIYLGENIKKLRLEKGITQEKLAEFLGVTFQSVSRWERGESYPDITMLPLLSTFFGVSADCLLGIDKAQNEAKINEYLNLYDTMKMVDMPSLFEKFCTAVREFPGDYRITVRYMELLQEEKLFNCSLHTDDYKKVSEEITSIYENIQKHCTDDNVRIRSKKVMISHLMWKYDCMCNEEGKYQVFDEYMNKAKEIANSLPCICDSKELLALDRDNYYETHKIAIEELLFHLHKELHGYCFQRSASERIRLYEALQNLLELIYTDGNFGKNSFNRLYNSGSLGHLYHQAGNNEKALYHLRSAAEYAVLLDKAPESTERIKRFYNHGAAHREMSAAEFMKAVMTKHYPLSEEFKTKEEFKEISESLN